VDTADTHWLVQYCGSSHPISATAFQKCFDMFSSILSLDDVSDRFDLHFKAREVQKGPELLLSMNLMKLWMPKGRLSRVT
jgi:hypothetical protein